jgi:hypothetical protein
MAWSPLHDSHGCVVQHACKFLRAHGSYVINRRMSIGQLAFGGMKAQSRIIHGYCQAGDGLPQWLHEAYWQRPSARPPA